ncbi:MAG: YciI family protein [Thalassotalea sp.]
MKFITYSCLFLLSMLSLITSAQTQNPNYDAVLATKLGADDYGMKSYVFVVLKSGDNKNEDKILRNKAFSGHMANINRLVKANKLVIAGPFGKNNDDYRGLFILDVKTLDEAKALLATDPAISANYLSAELYNWYGSAALAEYLEASDKVWKIQP